MYGRAPRALTVAVTGTADDVGPGTYWTNNSDPSKKRADGYAPFLSMTARDSFLNVPDNVIAAPGPGQYDLNANGKVKGGSTLGNKSLRFDGKKEEVPGPGSYNVSGGQKNKLMPSNKEATKQQRVTYSRKADPPSIPTPGQAYGYHEADDGTLEKQRIPERDKTLGPAFYKVVHDETETVQKYKGIHFGKLTSKRETTQGPAVPGPGQYDPYRGKPKAPIDYIIEEQRKQPLDSKLPRYHEIIEIVEDKKAVPGPGKYEIRSQFDNAPPQPVDAAERPPFGASSNRFLESKKLMPAPGSYNDPRNAFETLNRMTGLKRSPFGQTSLRFEKQHHVKRTPGPGAYNHMDIARESQRKAYLSRSRKGGFGSTTYRAVELSKKDDVFIPGPSHYLVEDKATVRKPQQTQSVFVSTTNRLQTPTPIVNDIPPPGSYEVSNSYDKTQGRVLYPKSQGENPSTRRKGAFLSSTKRFSKPRDVMIKSADRTNPGPGKYEVKSSTAPGGSLVSKEGRFKSKKSDVPGPGAYELSPLIKHTVLRGTYNATLNNPAAQTFDEVQQRTKHKNVMALSA